MQAVILAGGLGTRLSEETSLKPKPMVEIGGKPVLWHIMKTYSHYGVNEFIICLGYKGEIIKEFFRDYYILNSDITINLKDNSCEIHKDNSENWKITLVDTGADTQTGGRLKRVEKFLEDEFFFTYGDGLSDININKLYQHHSDSKALATLSAVFAPGRFGALSISKDKVTSFKEKPLGDNSRINGGFFVLNKKVIDLIDSDETIWEKSPLENLSQNNQLAAYLHDGFWQPMDTLRDKMYLSKLWENQQAPWKIWND